MSVNEPNLSTRPAGLWAHIHGLGVLGDLGSYTAAAQRLGLSKAAMSQRMADLERAVGVPLVQRTTRSVRLTEAGEQLVQATRGGFEQIERAFAGVRDLAGVPRGRLRVSAPVALGRQQIAPALPTFLRENPEVQVELVLTDTLVSLAQEGFDLAVRHTSHPPETHVAWALTETRSVLVASPDYLARHGEPDHPEQLAASAGRHQCLYYPRAGVAPTWQFRHRDGVGVSGPGAPFVPGSAAGGHTLTVAIRGPLGANNSEVLREGVLAGLGIALLPDFSAAAALRDGRLVPLLPAWQAQGVFGDHVFALRPYSPYVPRAVHALVAHWREVFRPGFVTGVG